MALPLQPPVKPMLAKAATNLPVGDGLYYEPKWDGFHRAPRWADCARRSVALPPRRLSLPLGDD